MEDKIRKKIRRQKRVRAKIKGTKDVPRLSVFRSNNHIYAQFIDDKNSKTLLRISDFDLKKKNDTKSKVAEKLGEETAKKAKEAGIEKVVFDRGSYKYHGRVKALAESARKAGLQF